MWFTLLLHKRNIYYYGCFVRLPVSWTCILVVLCFVAYTKRNIHQINGYIVYIIPFSFFSAVSNDIFFIQEKKRFFFRFFLFFVFLFFPIFFCDVLWMELLITTKNNNTSRERDRKWKWIIHKSWLQMALNF